MIPFSLTIFLGYPYFLIFCEEERIKIGLYKKLLVMFFRFFIAVSPCQVVNFQSDVHFIYGYSKNKQ